MAERPVMWLFVAASIADHGDAGVYANADAEFCIELLAPFFVEIRKRLLHGKGVLTDKEWMVGLVDGCVPHRHQSVAEIADGRSVKIPHAGIEPVHD